MLTELYNYAITNDLTAVAGYKEKTVKAYLSFSANGKFLGIVPSDTGKEFFPDIGSAANSATKCNYFAEKAKYVLLLDNEKNTVTKNTFLLEGLKSAAEKEPLFKWVISALEDEETLKTIQETFVQQKYKHGDTLGYEVDGIKLEKCETVKTWWLQFRQRFLPQNYKQGRCLITGELTEPMATVPKVSGLISVGGHTAGDALLCFDKKAFCSFGLEKSQNAVVSEEAMTAVNAALGELITNSGKPICGAKYLHWYSEPIESKLDLIPPLIDGFEGYNNDGSEMLQISSNEVKKLISSIYSGARPEVLESRYYLMPVSGVNGRMMIRAFMEGEVRDLVNCIKKWFDDLSLIKPNGKGLMNCPKYFVLCIRLMKPQNGNDIRKIAERMDSELSALSPQLLRAAYQDAVVPDAVASRSLAFIRSKMLESDNEGNTNLNVPDAYACMLLKLWLVRRARKKGGDCNMLGEEVNNNYNGSAYHIGRLMAVYAAVQSDALGRNLGAGVVQRYYASASSSPALVIGKLSQLSQYHLSKIENRGVAIRYQKMLDEIYSHLSAKLPTTMTLQEQSEFAVGYYQQHAAIFSTGTISKSTSDTKEED